MKVFSSVDEFAGAVGTDLGTTQWLEIDQTRIDKFADATDDHQWIHVDPERAATGPFGTTIAHGLLTLSLMPLFMEQLCEVKGVSMGVNYGFNKVRFITPVPSGSRLRGSGTIAEMTKFDGGVQAVLRITIEVEGSAKPACVIESVGRYYA